MDLLLYECNSIQHYTTIKNFSRLASGPLSNHNCATYCCKKCLHAYSTQELLNAHAKYCCLTQRTKFFKEPRYRFTNIQKQLPAPFAVYTDFESILKPVNEDVDVTQGVETGMESASHVFQEHIACSFVDPGEDAAEKFVRDLQLEAKQLFDEYIATPKPNCLLLQNHDRLTVHKTTWR